MEVLRVIETRYGLFILHPDLDLIERPDRSARDFRSVVSRIRNGVCLDCAERNVQGIIVDNVPIVY